MSRKLLIGHLQGTSDYHTGKVMMQEQINGPG
jgi:hypothetical protein